MHADRESATLRRAGWIGVTLVATAAATVVMLIATTTGNDLALTLVLVELLALAGLVIWVRRRFYGHATHVARHRDVLVRQTDRLEQHSLELTDRAAEIHSQAMTLEQETAEAQAISDELEIANQSLGTALADAEDARRAAEHSARERQETLRLFELVLSRASIGFALLDEQLRFVSINETLAAMNGFPVSEHIGRQVFERIPSELAPRLKDVLEHVLRTGRPVLGLEMTAAAADDAARIRHGIASYYPVPGDGTLPTVIGVLVEDTTERKELELQLAQSQRMEAVGRLAGGVAHDFNNLLTVIKSYSTILLSALEGDARREDVEEIAAAADRAAALTRQLLAFSRRQMMQPRALHLNAVVTDVEKMLRRLIGEDIALLTRLDPELWLVHADPGQIEQVIVNLVVNSRDAMPNGGHLTIETENVPRDAGSYVMLAISDTGVGMTPEIRAHLFEPFFTTKERGKGTGLGLSTVYGIVKQSGGDIAVQAESGKGATFKIFLPRHVVDHDPRSEIERTAPLPPRGTETILLVEDDPSLRTLAERILRSFGYTVLVASTGQRALTLVDAFTGRIDLVTTDVVMPEMSGTVLVERLLSVVPDIHVLFMSGYTDDEVVRRGILDRRAAFLQKPFTPDQLAFKVREVLDRNRSAQLTKAT
ncbi:MAG TPA: ATP-binding protein [Gemmatimonadaceae bacterium]